MVICYYSVVELFWLSLFLLLLTVRWSAQDFVHIKFVIRCRSLEPRWQDFHISQHAQNNVLKKTSLCLRVIFQQRRFLKYSRSYWVNVGFQGCQGTVNRICFPQQLLSWTRSSIQHLCWAPSDESLWVCQAFQSGLFIFIQERKSN